MAHPYPLPYPQGTPSNPAIIRCPSFVLVARQIYTRDGMRGFFRGLGPCFLRAFPVNASAIFVYEGTMRILGAEKVYHTTFIKWSCNLTTLTDTQLEF